MNFKSLLASIGIALNSLFSPLNVSASVIGDLNTTQLLYPVLPFDSFLAQKDRDLYFGSIPNRWNTTFESDIGSGSIIKNSQYLTAISSNRTGSNQNIFYLSKFNQLQAGDMYIIDDMLTPTSYGGFDNTNYGSTNYHWNAVDFTYVAHDFVILKHDFQNINLKFYTTGADTALTGHYIDYSIDLTLNSYIYDTSGEFGSYDDYTFNKTGRIVLNNFTTEFNSYSGIQVNSMSINIYDLFSEFLVEETTNVYWLSDFVIQLGYSTTGDNIGSSLKGFGWSMPYYTSDLITSRTGYDLWLYANDLENIGDSCECPTCPECSICPGQDINIDFTSWIATAVGGFLAFEIFPGFSLVGILAIFITISVVIWILKLMAGG